MGVPEHNYWSSKMFLIDRWYEKATDKSLENGSVKRVSPEELKKTQNCPEFDKEFSISKKLAEYSVNRLVQGYFRYGDVQRESLKSYPLCREAKRRLKKFRETKNREYLVDALNMLKLYYLIGFYHKSNLFKKRIFESNVDLIKILWKIIVGHLNQLIVIQIFNRR